MKKLSRTNVSTGLTFAAGAAAVLAFVVENESVGEAALSVAVVLVAATVRSTARDQERRTRALRSEVAAGTARISQLETRADELGASAERIIKSHRRTVRTMIAQGDRIEERTDALGRRILADLSAARLEASEG